MNRRLLKYDLIRITAIMMVVMLHCTTMMAVRYTDASSSEFLVGNLFNCLARAGTPMFLLLTGALLLDEKKSFNTRQFYRKSFLWIALLLVFWLLFYACWRSFALPALQGKAIREGDFVSYLLTLRGSNRMYPHLWYLFMLLGAYLIVPVLRLFVKKENKPYILGMILISIFAQFAVRTFGSLTISSNVTVADFVGKFHLEYATGYVPYLLIGWYLTAFPPTGKTRILLIAAGAAAAALIVLAVLFGINEIKGIRDVVAEMDTLPALVYGVGLFTLISALAGEKETTGIVVRELSRASFGVYIIHVVVLDVLTNILLSYETFGGKYPLLYILSLFALTYGISLGIVLLFSRVKGIRKLFHY